MSDVSGAPSASLSDDSVLTRIGVFATQVYAVVAADMQKLRRDPFDLFTRAIQPLLWLLLFGGVMAQVRGLSTGNTPYLDFLAPGILAQSILFAAIFFGITVVWERDLGVLHRYLVSPAPRAALVIGKGISATPRGLMQAVLIYLASGIMGVDLNLDPLHVLGVMALVALGSALFATLSLVLACLMKTRERMMGVGQMLTMPLFFASNAIYPIALMPGWLRAVSSLNPLSYEVDGLRALMIVGGEAAFGLPLDFAVMIGGLAVLMMLATRLYPRMAY